MTKELGSPARRPVRTPRGADRRFARWPKRPTRRPAVSRERTRARWELRQPAERRGRGSGRAWHRSAVAPQYRQGRLRADRHQQVSHRPSARPRPPLRSLRRRPLRLFPPRRHHHPNRPNCSARRASGSENAPAAGERTGTRSPGDQLPAGCPAGPNRRPSRPRADRRVSSTDRRPADARARLEHPPGRSTALVGSSPG